MTPKESPTSSSEMTKVSASATTPAKPSTSTAASAATPTAGNFLELFYALGDDDKEKRQAASTALVVYLDSVRDADFYTRELAYALKRLVSGLKSSRASARPGFAGALSNLLQHDTDLSTEHVYNQITEGTKVTGTVLGHDRREAFFGRIFGYAALERAGRFNVSASEDADERAKVIEIMGEILHQCCELAADKPWIGDLATNLAVSILESTSANPKETRALIDRVPPMAVSSVKELTTDQLLLALELQDMCGNELGLLAPVSTALKKSILRAGKLSLLREPLLAASSTFPRLHTVWISVMSKLVFQPKLFLEFWTTVVDRGLLASASHERRCTAFHLFLEASRMLMATNQADRVAGLLTPALMRCLMNNLGTRNKKTTVLQKQAKDVLKKLSGWLATWQDSQAAGYQVLLDQPAGKTLKALNESQVAATRERGRITVLGALLVNGDRNFDMRTQTSTVKTVLSTVGPDALMEHLAFLITEFRDVIVTGKNSRTAMVSGMKKEDAKVESETKDDSSSDSDSDSDNEEDNSKDKLTKEEAAALVSNPAEGVVADKEDEEKKNEETGKPSKDPVLSAQLEAADALFTLARTVDQGKLKDSVIEPILMMLMGVAFFEKDEDAVVEEEAKDVKKSSKKSAKKSAKKPKKLSVQGQAVVDMLSTAEGINEQVRERCQDRFFSLLADVSAPAKPVKPVPTADKKNNNEKKQFAPVSNRHVELLSGAQTALSLWSKMGKWGMKVARPHTVAEERAWEQARSVVEDTKKGPKAVALRLLTAHVIVQSLAEDEAQDPTEMAQVVDDLKRVYEELVEEEDEEKETEDDAKSSGKKGKKKKSTPKKKKNHTPKYEGVDSMAVLVDVMVVLLSRQSAVLRDVVNTSFKMVCGGMTPAAVDTLVSVLVSSHAIKGEANGEDVGEEEDEEEEEEEEEEDNKSKSTKKKNEKAESDDEDEDDKSENEDDMDIDEEAAKALGEDGIKSITQALIKQVPEDDEEDNSNGEFDKYDNALAKYMRARSESKRTQSKAYKIQVVKQKLHFKLRVLDLLQSFVTTCPTHPLLAILPTPLLAASARCLRTGGVLQGRDQVALFSRLTALHFKLYRSRKVVVIPEEQTLPSSFSIASAFVGEVEEEEEEEKNLIVSPTDQAVALIQASMRAASKAGNPDMLQLSTASLLFAMRLGSRVDGEVSEQPAEVVEAFNTAMSAAFEDWLTRKTTKLTLNFFQEVFQKLQRAAWGTLPALYSLVVEGVSDNGGKIKSAFFRCEALQLLTHALKFRPMCVEEPAKRDDAMLASNASQLWACFRSNMGLMLGSEADVAADAVGKNESSKWLSMAQGMHKTARRKQVVQYGLHLTKALKKILETPKPALDFTKFMEDADRVISAGDNVAPVVNSVFQLKVAVEEMSAANGSSKTNKKRKGGVESATEEVEIEAEVAPVAVVENCKSAKKNKKSKVVVEVEVPSTDKKKKKKRKQIEEETATPVKEVVKSAKKSKKSMKKSAKK